MQDHPWNIVQVYSLLRQGEHKQTKDYEEKLYTRHKTGPIRIRNSECFTNKGFISNNTKLYNHAV